MARYSCAGVSAPTLHRRTRPQPLRTHRTPLAREVAMKAPHPLGRFCWLLVLSLSLPLASALHAQGVTPATLSGLITARDGGPLVNASVVAVHVPSGTQYRAVTRTGGAYTIPDMPIGAPYRVTFAAIGFEPQTRDSVSLSLGQNLRLDIRLARQAVQLAEVQVRSEEHTSELQSRFGISYAVFC